jgi:hypothetical protein
MSPGGGPASSTSVVPLVEATPLPPPDTPLALPVESPLREPPPLAEPPLLLEVLPLPPPPLALPGVTLERPFWPPPPLALLHAAIPAQSAAIIHAFVFISILRGARIVRVPGDPSAVGRGSVDREDGDALAKNLSFLAIVAGLAAKSPPLVSSGAFVVIAP